MKVKIHFIILLVFVQFFISHGVLGQELKRFDEMISQGVSLHIFADKGEATIRVLVLGTVGSGGVYEISPGLRVDQLLAFAGGLELNDELRVTVQLYREEVRNRTLVYEARMEDFLLKPGEYPQLIGGDIIVVRSKEKVKFGWRDILSIITSLTAVTTLVRILRQ